MLPSRKRQKSLDSILQSDFYENIVQIIYLNLERRICSSYCIKHGKPPSPEMRNKIYDTLIPMAREAAVDVIAQILNSIDFGNDGWYLFKKFGPIFALAGASTFCATRLLWCLYKGGYQLNPLPIDPYMCIVAILLPWCFVIAALIAEFKSN